MVPFRQTIVVAVLLATCSAAPAEAKIVARVAVRARPVPAAPPPLICPEGTFQGRCVNPLLARFARDAAIAFTQAQISITERPYPASQDTTFSYPNNVAAFPALPARQTLIGNGGISGGFDRANRGE